MLKILRLIKVIINIKILRLIKNLKTTLGNVACNLSRKGTTKLRDKLQEKLPSVTAPLGAKACC